MFIYHASYVYLNQEFYRDFSLDLEEEDDENDNTEKLEDTNKKKNSTVNHNTIDLTKMDTTTAIDLTTGVKSYNLNNLLTQFFATEERDLDCENKECLSKTVKLSSKINMLPNILILHLKRFKYNQRFVFCKA